EHVRHVRDAAPGVRAGEARDLAAAFGHEHPPLRELVVEEVRSGRPGVHVAVVAGLDRSDLVEVLGGGGADRGGQVGHGRHSTTARTLSSMAVWDVLGKRTEHDEFAVVGGVKAPDPSMALLLARETHFRHKEGVAYAVRRRGDDEVLLGPYDSDVIGGVTDRSYRRQGAYAGVGGKLKRVSAEMSKRGLRIDRARPPVRRS